MFFLENNCHLDNFGIGLEFFNASENECNPAEERFGISVGMMQENKIKGLIVIALLFLIVAAVSEAMW